MKPKEVLELHKKDILSKKNVSGIARGFDLDHYGKVRSEDEVIVVFVQEKQPISTLDTSDIIPPSIEGIPTKVRRIGRVEALSEVETLQSRSRPASGGSSIGYKKMKTGTMGTAFKHAGQTYILSNNHVIGNTNDSSERDQIIQPGADDGGTFSDTIAELDKKVNIEFKNSNGYAQEGLFQKIANFFRRLFGKDNNNQSGVDIKKDYPVNVVDCAVAKVIQDSFVSDELLSLGKINGIREPQLGMKVRKVGRSTGVTEGRIIQLDATLEVHFSLDRVAMFDGQIITEGMSDKGDSGSVLIDEDNYIVGLIFSGNKKYTVANDITQVFEMLDMMPDFS